MNRALTPITLVLLALTTAACSSTSTRFAAQPLPAIPAAPVQTAALEPVDPPPTEEDPLGPADGQQVAALPSETQAVEVARDDLLGGWALSSGGETCQLFMSLTQWTGGYRASTRGCQSEQLAQISAWDLQGKTISLKGSEGAPVATLFASSPQTFNGSTSGGSPITVSR